MGYILLTPQLTDSLTHFSPVSWLRNKGPGICYETYASLGVPLLFCETC